MIRKMLLTLVALLLTLTLVVGAVACDEEEEETPTPTATLKVGSVMDLTGALAGMGPSLRDGAILAAKEINDAGGINGSQIELIVEDGATDAAIGLEAVKKLVEVNGVKVIIGPMITGATLASGPYVAEREVLIISPSATSADIADQEWRKFVFRTPPTDALQGVAMSQLVTEGGYEKVALFVMDNQYGTGIEEVVEATLGDSVEIVSSTRYDPVKMDYLTELQIVKDKNPDVVVHVGYGDDSQIVYKQALELGLDTIQWITAEGNYAETTLEMAETAEFMEKAVMGTKATADETMYADFVAAFEAEFDYTPGIYAEYSYDAMKLAAMAIEQAGYEDAAAISDALMEIGQGYAGVSGLISFSENGDRGGGTFEVWQVVIDDEGPRFDTVKIISF